VVPPTVLRTVVLVLPPLKVVFRTERLPILVIVEILVTRFLFLRTIVLDIFLLPSPIIHVTTSRYV
jgi:hypothetical protein